MLYEDEVVATVCAFLQADGWTIVSRALAVQHGDDIVAVRGTGRLVVEAKGATSSKPDSPSYGKPFTLSQVKSHVGVAVLRALGVVSEGSAAAAVAFPDNDHHRRTAGRAAPALARIGVTVFWVAEDRSVVADPPYSAS